MCHQTSRGVKDTILYLWTRPNAAPISTLETARALWLFHCFKGERHPESNKVAFFSFTTISGNSIRRGWNWEASALRCIGMAICTEFHGPQILYSYSSLKKCLTLYFPQLLFFFFKILVSKKFFLSNIDVFC